MNTPILYDISPVLSEDSAVWPGDVRLTRSIQCQLSAGANIDLSSVSTTVHIGAHADAPSHYHRDGESIDKVDLNPYIGACMVLHRIKADGALTVADVATAVEARATRVLFKTSHKIDPHVFSESFAFFSPEALQALAAAGTKLVGIDTPSVDAFSSKTLPAHQVLFQTGMRNLEGLDLSHVPEGQYELIALPLKLKGFDASPVRAILRPLPEGFK